MTTTNRIDRLIVVLPKDDDGTRAAARRYASRRYGVPQTRIEVLRPDEANIATAAAAHAWAPADTWYAGMIGWTPYVVVRGCDLFEGC